MLLLSNLHHTFAQNQNHSMKPIISLLLVFAFITTNAFSTGGKEGKANKKTSATVSLSGCVEDELNSEKLVCAKIEVEELDMVLFTDILGNFSIPDIKPGTYTFKVSYISYEDLQVTQSVVADEKAMNLQLKPL